MRVLIADRTSTWEAQGDVAIRAPKANAAAASLPAAASCIAGGPRPRVHSGARTPNPSLKPTRNGRPGWPRAVSAHGTSRGQPDLPPRAA